MKLIWFDYQTLALKLVGFLFCSLKAEIQQKSTCRWTPSFIFMVHRTFMVCFHFGLLPPVFWYTKQVFFLCSLSLLFQPQLLQFPQSWKGKLAKKTSKKDMQSSHKHSPEHIFTDIFMWAVYFFLSLKKQSINSAATVQHTVPSHSLLHFMHLSEAFWM